MVDGPGDSSGWWQTVVDDVAVGDRRWRQTIVDGAGDEKQWWVATTDSGRRGRWWQRTVAIVSGRWQSTAALVVVGGSG